MRLNIYSLGLMAGALLTMASCSNDESEGLKASVSDEINFSCYTGKPGSRAAATTSTSFDKFGVFAHWTKATAWSATAQNQRTPNFMYNQEVTKNVTAWQYNPQKYWPGNNDKVSFFAYAPYTSSPAAVSSGASGIIALSGNDVSGEPWLKFEVGKDISKHQDLMYAKAMDKTAANGTVNLEFNHALAQVSFKAIAWEADKPLGDANTTVTINSIKLLTKRKSATLNVSSGAWSAPVDVTSGWNQMSLTAANGHLKNNVFTGGASVTNRVMPDNDYIMMFPNLGINDQYCVLVDYTIYTADSKLPGGGVSSRKNVFKYITPKFAAGKSYTLTIHLGMNVSGGGGSGDTPTPPVVEKDDPNEPDPAPPTDNSNVNFTATCGDWGTISDQRINLYQE